MDNFWETEGEFDWLHPFLSESRKIIDAPASVSVLSETEKMAGKKMCLCVSRAKLDKLVMDV